jgi:HD-GYP domain-containing protein (c-di-GMP phosphodiesterase class II)
MYKRIHLEGLRVNSTLEFPLYLQYTSSEFALYKSESAKFSSKDRERLLRSATPVYILLEHNDAYLNYLSNEISNILIDKAITNRVKGQLLYHVSTGYIQEVFSSKDALDATQRQMYLIEQIISLWLSDPEVLTSITLLNTHNDYEYKHSVQVASICIILGSICFDLSRFELMDLGVGGLLHDVGKIHIDNNILTKSSKLSEEETKLIHMHPEDAYVYLKKTSRLDPTVLEMIRDHHETLDGLGYPKGISGEKIGRNARIVAVADIFCALISDRPYRPAHSHPNALEILKTDFSKKLDKRIIEVLERELGKTTR